MEGPNRNKLIMCLGLLRLGKVDAWVAPFILSQKVRLLGDFELEFIVLSSYF